VGFDPARSASGRPTRDRSRTYHIENMGPRQLSLLTAVSIAVLGAGLLAPTSIEVEPEAHCTRSGRTYEHCAARADNARCEPERAV